MPYPELLNVIRREVDGLLVLAVLEGPGSACHGQDRMLVPVVHDPCEVGRRNMLDEVGLLGEIRVRDVLPGTRQLALHPLGVGLCAGVVVAADDRGGASAAGGWTGQTTSTWRGLLQRGGSSTDGTEGQERSPIMVATHPARNAAPGSEAGGLHRGATEAFLSLMMRGRSGRRSRGDDHDGERAWPGRMTPDSSESGIEGRHAP